MTQDITYKHVTSVAKPKSSPVSLSEREHILDVLRGIALFGILIINVLDFSGYGNLTVEMKREITTQAGYFISALLEMFAHGKFYSIFSLLFGLGFSIIIMRLQKKGVNALKVFYRRLFWLLMIGLIHIYFMWWGDILVLYALLGMLLPLFRNLSNKALLTWATALILSPVLIDLMKWISEFQMAGWLENVAISIEEKNGIFDDNWRRWLYTENSGWNEFWAWQQAGPFWRFSTIIETNRIPKVLGMFILGYYVGKNCLYKNLKLNKALFKRICIWGFIVGLPANIVWTYYMWGKDWSNNVDLVETMLYALGVVPLALAYVAALFLYWAYTGGKTRLMIFAPVGRMALTNYIMQTVLGILVFYEIGLGLGGNMKPTLFIPIVVCIYAFQVVFSKYWLKYFNYGPLEWIWRVLTYQKRIPIIR